MWPSANSPSYPRVLNSSLNLNPLSVLYCPLSLFSFISRYMPTTVLYCLCFSHHYTGKMFPPSQKVIYPWTITTKKWYASKCNYLPFQRKIEPPTCLSLIFAKFAKSHKNGHIPHLLILDIKSQLIFLLLLTTL